MSDTLTMRSSVPTKMGEPFTGKPFDFVTLTDQNGNSFVRFGDNSFAVYDSTGKKLCAPQEQEMGVLASEVKADLNDKNAIEKGLLAIKIELTGDFPTDITYSAPSNSIPNLCKAPRTR